MYSRVGKVIPLYCTAIGKVFLSEMGPEELDNYFKAVPLKAFTKHTLKEDEIRASLPLIRENGYAIDSEEHEESIICISAPIRDYSGSAIAALSVSYPIFRIDDEEKEKAIGTLLECASRLSEEMGYDPEPN